MESSIRAHGGKTACTKCCVCLHRKHRAYNAQYDWQSAHILSWWLIMQLRTFQMSESAYSCFWPPFEVLLEQPGAEKPLPAAAAGTWRKQLRGFVFVFRTHVPRSQECWKGAGVGSLTCGARAKPAPLAQAKVPSRDVRQHLGFSENVQPLLSKGMLALRTSREQ